MNQTETSPATTVRPARARKPVVLITGGVLAAGALIGGGLLASQAFFTSQAEVAGQDISAATVRIVADTANTSAPIQAASLLPGDTESTTITLENDGSEDVYYTVRLPKESGDAVLEDVLEVTVAIDGTSETLSLSDWQDGALQIEPALAEGATQEVTVTVVLPSGADNTVQGAEAGFRVRFDAIQARNTTAPTAGWTSD